MLYVNLKKDQKKLKKFLTSELNNRVKFHLSFKLGQGQEVIDAHSKLNQNSINVQLTLAALHYLKNEN